MFRPYSFEVRLSLALALHCMDSVYVSLLLLLVHTSRACVEVIESVLVWVPARVIKLFSFIGVLLNILAPGGWWRSLELSWVSHPARAVDENDVVVTSERSCHLFTRQGPRHQMLSLRFGHAVRQDVQSS